MRRGRALPALALAALAGAILVAAGAVRLVDSVVRDRAVQRIDAETALLGDWIRSAGAGADLQGLVEDASASLQARVTLITADGTVLADSARGAKSLAEMDNHLDRPEVQSARLRGRGESRRTSATTNVEYFYSARKIEDAGPAAYVRVALPASRVGQVRADYAWLIGALTLAATLVLLVGGYVAVRGLAGPMERLARAVDRSVGRDGTAEIPQERGESRIWDLAYSVRNLQSTLLGRIAVSDAGRAELSSVIAGIREGVLLVGSDRRVRLANPALRRLLDEKAEPQGRLFEEIVRHPQVIRGIESVLSKGEEVQGEVLALPASQRVFQLRVSCLEEAPGTFAALVMFFDISRLERLERVRRDFVADVSHELRTPLTSIKAATENLSLGVDDPEASRQFLDMIQRHVERMSALVDDLTDLSLIETGSITLNPSRLDASAVVDDVLEQLRPLAASHDVELVAQMPERFPLTVDRLRLEQMLNNLVTNAIKFNRTAGRVVVRAEKQAAARTIYIEDTGVGIPADSLDKVFQRFYRVDRARSQAVGGTGLGLSIVKHLMRLHEGRVRVESELGQGSRFYLDFPLDEPARPVPIASAR